MIARMVKQYVVARAADRDALLEALGRLGVVHLVPVDAAKAAAEPKILAQLDQANRAIQILSSVKPEGARPAVEPMAAVHEVMRIERESAERTSRLTNLYRQMECFANWGDVRLSDFDRLRQDGVDIQLYSVPAAQLDEVKADLVEVLAPAANKRLVIVTANRWSKPVLPESARPIPMPTRDMPSLREEAAGIDSQLKQDRRRQAELANMLDDIRRLRMQLEADRDWAAASSGALANENLFGVQGWVPADHAESVLSGLEAAGIYAAVETMQVSDDDKPPTLIRPPKWAKPVESLLKILGTVPGYREYDVAPAFMLALPLFAAMLISDGGYGLLFLLAPLIWYRRICAGIGAGMTHLLIIFGVTALAWGVITGSFFGVGPEAMRQSGGLISHLGEVLSPLQIITVDITEESQQLMMQLCFIIAAIHLSLAQLWRATAIFPNLRFLSNIGWAVLLWGMYGLVKSLVLKDPPIEMLTDTPYIWLLGIGGGMAFLFAGWDPRHPVKGTIIGILNSIFPAIATFSDTISYVRLMAIGLASTVLAVSFNDMAKDSPSVFITIPLLLIGHGLNIALCMIALVAHGVRLNILEFSNNLGMEWTGYSYAPFIRGVKAVTANQPG